MHQRAAGPGGLPQERSGLDRHLTAEPLLKITFLCPHLRVAGGVRAILEYADRLAARGHDVEVVVPARRRATAMWRAWRGVGPEWMRRFRAHIRWVARWTPQALPEADVVVATAWQSAPVVAAASPTCGAKLYLVQHYESLYHGEASRVDATYRLPLRIVTISSWLADIMHERFGRSADVLVTPVDTDLFRPIRLERRAGPPRVLMLHHDYEWKGAADGLEAIARARRSIPALQLIGFGLKPPRRPMPYDEFHTNPPQEGLAEIYSSCDIYLCPSWDEGLGMPAMEAMACGAALVTYDNGGCRDYARDGETALVARRRDVGDLAEKLVLLASDPGRRQRLAAAGRAFVLAAFSWDRAVARLETIVAEACQRRRA